MFKLYSLLLISNLTEIIRVCLCKYPCIFLIDLWQVSSNSIHGPPNLTVFHCLLPPLMPSQLRRPNLVFSLMLPYLRYLSPLAFVSSLCLFRCYLGPNTSFMAILWTHKIWVSSFCVPEMTYKFWRKLLCLKWMKKQNLEIILVLVIGICCGGGGGWVGAVLGGVGLEDHVVIAILAHCFSEIV